MELARVTSRAAVVLLLGVGAVGCGSYLHAVDEGVYGALVPTTQQWADERAEGIPEGFAALRADGVERVVAGIEGDSLTFELDEETAVTRKVVERRDVQDSEGSGPFKADTQALALGSEPLVLGSLRVSDPVIWYAGGYDSTAVVAIKPWDPEERGPIVQCAAVVEQCLELPVGEKLVGGGQWCQPGSDCLWFLDEEGGEG